jgi:hypothetical protein
LTALDCSDSVRYCRIPYLIRIRYFNWRIEIYQHVWPVNSIKNAWDFRRHFRIRLKSVPIHFVSVSVHFRLSAWKKLCHTHSGAHYATEDPTTSVPEFWDWKPYTPESEVKPSSLMYHTTALPLHHFHLCVIIVFRFIYQLPT